MKKELAEMIKSGGLSFDKKGVGENKNCHHEKIKIKGLDLD